jgi:hypothetical protein
MQWAGWPPPYEEGERIRRHNIQKITEEGGEDGGDGSDDDDDDDKDATTTMMKPRSDRGCGGGEWRAAATAVAVATRECFGMIIWHPR